MIKPSIIYESEKLSRVTQIKIDGRIVLTPNYFPAISSYGIKFSFRDLLYFLKSYRYSLVLISAYDLCHMQKDERKKATLLMKSYRKNGVLFLDSGLFESSWKGDKEWNVSSYKNMLSQVGFDIYTSFDVYREDQVSYEKFKEATYNNILESSVFLDRIIFFAILHESSPQQLVRLIEEFAKKDPSLFGNIAIAERDTGKSIQERAETIISIRRILNDASHYNLLHVLGCGNPLSILIYSYCGADTFDSLDWVKGVVNSEDYSIRDFSHLDLLDCKCRVCSESPYKNAEYLEKTILHNLLFYRNFTAYVQSLIRNNNLKAYLRRYIGEKIMNQIEEY